MVDFASLYYPLDFSPHPHSLAPRPPLFGPATHLLFPFQFSNNYGQITGVTSN